MNHLQNFGKIIDLKKYNLGDFARFLLIKKKSLSDDISAVSKRQIMNYAFCIILKLRYYSQCCLFTI